MVLEPGRSSGREQDLEHTEGRILRRSIEPGALAIAAAPHDATGAGAKEDFSRYEWMRTINGIVDATGAGAKELNSPVALTLTITVLSTAATTVLY
jgi:hypothetical protein